MNMPGYLPYIVLFSYIGWLVFEAVETSKSHGETRKQAKWTVYLYGFNIFLLCIFSIIEYQTFARTVVPVSLAGAVLILIKILIKRWSMRALGDEFHIHLIGAGKRRLVRSGPYAFLRHPTYAARLLATIGIPLLMNAFVTLAIVGLLDLFSILLRIREEDRLLREVFRDSFEEYRRNTPALIPFPLKFLFAPIGGAGMRR